MKKIFMATFAATLITTNLNAADVTIFYMDTCPHCHHAMDFIEGKLMKDTADVNYEKVNLASEENRAKFFNAKEDCGLSSNGVPVIIANGHCFQGYGNDETTGQEIRNALTAEPGKAQKKTEVNKGGKNFLFWGALVLIVLGLGLLVAKKKKK